MSVPGERLRQMELEVRKFHARSDDRDHNHRHYLAEVAQFLRTVQDPLDVLRFVERLIVSPFAKRPQQKQALSDVGEWLFARLLRDPRLERDALAWELGWMQRLVAIRDTTSSPQAPATSYAGGGRGRGPEVQVPDFRKKIEAIERRRAEASTVSRAPKVVAPVVRVAPERLPETFDVEFADLNAARAARKNAQDRKRAGKAPKPVWIALAPVDKILVVLAGNLGCSLDTEGLEAVFDDFAKRAGMPRPFSASDLRREGDRHVVGRVSLPST